MKSIEIIGSNINVISTDSPIFTIMGMFFLLNIGATIKIPLILKNIKKNKFILNKIISNKLFISSTTLYCIKLPIFAYNPVVKLIIIDNNQGPNMTTEPRIATILGINAKVASCICVVA